MSKTGLTHFEDLLFLDPIKLFKILADIFKGEAQISKKWDGNPSIIIGRRDGQFFVSTKGKLFGKHAKVYYDAEEIRRDYATLPLIYSRLSCALHELRNLQFSGYLRGDILYTFEELNLEKYSPTYNLITFEPNIVKYAAPAASTTAARMIKSSIGVAFHMHYTDIGSHIISSTNSPHLENLYQNQTPSVFCIASRFGMVDPSVVGNFNNSLTRIQECLPFVANLKSADKRWISQYISNAIRSGQYSGKNFPWYAISNRYTRQFWDAFASLIDLKDLILTRYNRLSYPQIFELDNISEGLVVNSKDETVFCKMVNRAVFTREVLKNMDMEKRDARTVCK